MLPFMLSPIPFLPSPGPYPSPSLQACPLCVLQYAVGQSLAASVLMPTEWELCKATFTAQCAFVLGLLQSMQAIFFETLLTRF